MHLSSWKSVARFALFSAIVSCSGSTEPEPVASVTVTAAGSSVKAAKTIQLTGQPRDAGGNDLTGRPIIWASGNNGIATVSADGLVSAIAPGTVLITATSEGKIGNFSLTVVRASLATIVVAVNPLQLIVGQTVTATTTMTDSTNRVVTDAVLTWFSSDQSVASVNASGVITALSPGTTRIDARAEGIVGSATITVVAAPTCTSTLTLAVGDIRTLTASEKSAFCINGVAGAEFTLMPFNNSAIAAIQIGIQAKGTNISAPLPSVLSASASASASVTSPSGLRTMELQGGTRISDWDFRMREDRDLAPALRASRQKSARGPDVLTPRRITDVPANPAVGDVYNLNANVSGNTCSGAKQLHPSRVVAVFPHVIVMADTLAPAGGYTSAEMTALGQSFENIGYGVDTVNFGSPTDIDGNGRVVVFFTTGVNVIPGPANGFIAGLFAARDLFPLTSCVGSNEGEMFYLPVPDPASTINGNYTNKTGLANSIPGVLVHEFQHLINASRRIYITDADAFETIWLNEGLSHIAEELLYYQISGNTPRTNIDLNVLRSSQAQLDAVNSTQVQNLARLSRYMAAPETNSPYAQNDVLETRGAIWELLRYAADRKGGNERSLWLGLVNSPFAGQANFNSVLGDIVSFTRDWTVAQFADDLGFPLPPQYVNPSWNFRSILPVLNSNVFPLMTRTLTTTPLDVTLAGGGVAYFRFQISNTTSSAITLTSSGQPLPASVDVTLMRTK